MDVEVLDAGIRCGGLLPVWITTMDEEDATTESLETWPLLAQFVRERGREVQAIWLERAKRRPRARGLTDSALLACISPLLRWLADRGGPPDNASIASLTDTLARARAEE